MTEALPKGNAYFIKLGQRGEWEAECIETGIARISWRHVAAEMINKGAWSEIKTVMQQHSKTPTSETNALEIFARSTEDDIWITFHASKLWWAQLTGVVEEDGISKFRRVLRPWCSTNLAEPPAPILANQISGRISQIQGFRGTICRVRAREDLDRLIAGTHSPEHAAIKQARAHLVREVARGVRHLHWKDFELLVDAIFQQSGWRRLSRLGETMKSVDLELEDPIGGDLYQVQVKSHASAARIRQCREEFLADGATEFRRFYFVVHTPEDDLSEFDRSSEVDDRFVVIAAQRLAEMVVDVGLTNWVLEKIP